MLDLQIAIAREAGDGLVEIVAEPAKELPGQVAVRTTADITIHGGKPGGLAVIEGQNDAAGEDRIGPQVMVAESERGGRTSPPLVPRLVSKEKIRVPIMASALIEGISRKR